MSFHPPEFFKIMQNHEVELRLPKKFVERHWKGISNPVVLKIPNGVQQEIFWAERDGDIWFQKNWEKFAKFLKFGYAVVFKYKGGSYFKVKIFGVNTLEIDYSKIKFIDEVCDESIEEIVEVNDKSLNESEISKQARTKVNGKRKINMDFDTAQQKNSGTNEENMIKKTKRCPTTAFDNPCFQLKLTQSYVQGNILKIPCEFSREYLNKFKGTATIRVGEDKTMELMMTFDSTDRRSIVTSGWRLFSQKYNLKVGDLCKFEMIRSKPLSFTITIMRAREERSPDQSLGHKEGISCDNTILKRKDIQGTSRIRAKIHLLGNSEGQNAMKHDKFEICLNSTYPYVPNKFWNRHRECHGKFVELKVDEKSWFVKVNYSNRGSRLCSGWKRFVRDCKLEIGDSCLFELIDEKTFVFKVSL